MVSVENTCTSTGENKDSVCQAYFDFLTILDIGNPYVPTRSLPSLPTYVHTQNLNAPQREKTCFLTYADKKDSDQTAHARSLIRVFVVRVKKLGIGYPITKTCLYNVDPLKPHFYIVKQGFTGVYIIFLFCSKAYIEGTR